jgi:putative ATP-dependent endonuclease of OLD family
VTTLQISEVHIQNFRNFRSLSISLDRVTVIIGDNNSGKTNILDALYRGLRANRVVREGAFEPYDFHLSTETSKPGDDGPIRIRIIFREQTIDEWQQQIADALTDVIQIEDSGLRSVIIEVLGTFNPINETDAYQWSFQNLAYENLTQKARQFQAFSALRELRPFFYLDALRDASREFQARASFFGAFVRQPILEDEEAKEIQTQLSGLNDRLLNTQTTLASLKQTLADGNKLFHGGHVNDVIVEPIPTRLDDLLSRTQISIASGSSARLPMDRQGSGTRSVSVISLFRSFVETELLSAYTEISEPIVGLEEPETHLHPSAVRILWKYLESVPGQKIISTHSGQLLAQVPLASIRRLVRTKIGVECRSIDTTKFTSAEERRIGFHVKQTRGELFFASAWLLVEGETEDIIFPAVADVVGVDLEAKGIRIISYAQSGLGLLCKLADQLGIPWHCVADGDDSGLQYARTARDLLNGRDERLHLTVLPERCIEIHFCVNGFESLYENSLTPAKFATLPAKSDPDYWLRLVNILDKPQCATVLAAEIASKRRSTAAVEAVISSLGELLNQ